MDILDIAIAKQLAGGGGGSGTDNYNDLSNLPKINDVTLSGNKSSSALGLQSEITSENKLDSDLIDDTDQDNKFVTSAEKNTWNGKQNAIDADHKLNADYVDDSTSTNKFVTATDKETWSAKQNAIDNSHKLSSDLVDDANHTNKFVTSTEKSTWNAKQNAIDSEHKLSSSLVSFTTAEAAALASGIDSAKVAQISTNQSNILYVADRTSKNVLRTPRAYETGYSATVKGVTYTVQDDYSVKVNGTCTAGDYSTFVITSSTFHADNNYGHEISGFMLNGCPNLNGDLYIAVERSDSPYTSYGLDNGSNASGVTINNIPTNVNILIFIRVPSGKTINNAIVYPMIRPAFTDSTYQPPALPNYDLTRLEDEDRAALAQEIDAGAKNQLNLNGTQTSVYGLTVTWDYANGTVKVNGTVSGTSDPAAYIHLGSWTAPADGYYKLYAENANSSNIYVYNDATWGTNPSSSVLDSVRYFSKGTSFTHIYLRVVSGYTVNNVTIKPMICTKAAFGVSQKFVPYVQPVVREAIEITGAITTATGYSLINSLSHLYKMGNNVFGELIFSKNTGYFSTDPSHVATINAQYAPNTQFIGIGGFSTSEWAISTIGYVFVQIKTATSGEAGKVMVRDTVTTNNYVHVSVNYVT